MSRVFPISHQVNVLRKYAEEAHESRVRLKVAEEEYDFLEHRRARLQEQIEYAKLLKKDGFNRDLFMVDKRGKKDI